MAGVLACSATRLPAPPSRLQQVGPLQLVGHGDRVGRLALRIQRADSFENVAVRRAGRSLPPYSTRQPRLWHRAKAASPPAGTPLPGGRGAAPGRPGPGRSGRALGCQRSIGPRPPTLIRLAPVGQARWDKGVDFPWIMATRPGDQAAGQAHTAFHDSEPMFDPAIASSGPSRRLRGASVDSLQPPARVQVQSSKQPSLRDRPLPPGSGQTAGSRRPRIGPISTSLSTGLWAR